MPITGIKRKGPWTGEEDTVLKRYIEEFGTEDCWRNVPERAGLLRSGKSCRMRWVNYLRPDVKHGSITAEEQDLIVRLHKLIGNRWSLIAGRLPGRTDNEIKNFWKCYARKESGISAVNSNTPKRNKTSLKRSTEQRCDIGASAADLNSLKEVTEEKTVTASGIYDIGDQTIWNRKNKTSHNGIRQQCDSIAARVIPEQKLEITLGCTNTASEYQRSKFPAGQTNPERHSDPIGQQQITLKSSPCFTLKEDINPENYKQPMNWATSNCLPWMEHPSINIVSSSEWSSLNTYPSSSSRIRDTSLCTSYAQESPLESSPSGDRSYCFTFPSSSPEALSSTSCEKEEDLEIHPIHTSKPQFPFSSAGSGSEGAAFSSATVMAPEHTFLDTDQRAPHGGLINDLNWLENHVENLQHSHLYLPHDVLMDLENAGPDGFLHFPTLAAWEEHQEDFRYFKNLCG